MVTFCVLTDDKYSNELIEKWGELKCLLKGEQLMQNGFNDWVKGKFYICKSITGKDRYPVTLNISISGKELSDIEIFIMDEMFGEPHCVNTEYIERIDNILNDMVEKGIFKTE